MTSCTVSLASHSLADGQVVGIARNQSDENREVTQNEDSSEF